MNGWFVVIAVALIGAAVLGVFLAFQNPTFLVALVGAVATHAVSALLPKLLARKSPEAEARDRQDAREAVERTATGREREH